MRSMPIKAVEQAADKALEKGDVVREIPRELVPEFVKFFFPNDTSRMVVAQVKHDLEVQRCGIVEGMANQQEHKYASPRLKSRKAVRKCRSCRGAEPLSEAPACLATQRVKCTSCGSGGTSLVCPEEESPSGET